MKYDKSKLFSRGNFHQYRNNNNNKQQDNFGVPDVDSLTRKHEKDMAKRLRSFLNNNYIQILSSEKDTDKYSKLEVLGLFQVQEDLSCVKQTAKKYSFVQYLSKQQHALNFIISRDSLDLMLEQSQNNSEIQILATMPQYNNQEANFTYSSGNLRLINEKSIN